MLEGQAPSAALFREANVELGVTHEQQKNRHSVLTGNQKVTLNGEELTIPQARQRLDNPDRAVREVAAAEAVHQHDDRRSRDGKPAGAARQRVDQLRHDTGEAPGRRRVHG